MKKLTKIILSAATLLSLTAPLLSHAFTEAGAINPNALAQESSSISSGCSGITSLDGVVSCVSGFFNAAIYLLMSFALLYTIWSALQFIRADGEGRDEWRSKIVAGIIGLFVMSAIWGLVGILSGTFRLSNNPVSAPSIQIPH